jgi:PIN domain associated with the TPR-GreAB-C-PIN system
MLNGLVEEFGEATGVIVLRGSPEELIQQMAETVRALTVSAPLQELLLAARESRAPLGLLASIRGGSYASLVTQRVLPLVAGAGDDAEHDVEVANAVRAFGKPAVIDTTALHTLTAGGTLANLDGRFSSLQFPSASLRDVYRAVFEVRGLAGSPGTAGWDTEMGSLVFYELAEDEFTRRLRRSIELEERAQTLSIRSVEDLSLFQELGDDAVHSSWLAPIQLAYDQQLPLWSDDLGLRRLARHFGVDAFGTPAVIDALRDIALRDANDPQEYEPILARAASANQELAADLVVDVPLHLDDLLTLAEQTGWLPTAGALVLSRPSWWAWQPTPLNDLEALYAHVRQHQHDRFGEWQYAAMIGAARAYQHAGISTKMLAAIALLGLSASPPIDEMVGGCERARRVAAELGLPDPVAQLPAAAAALAKADRCDDPASLVVGVLAALAALEDGSE